MGRAGAGAADAVRTARHRRARDDRPRTAPGARGRDRTHRRRPGRADGSRTARPSTGSVERTSGADWYESMLAGYVTAGILNDVFASLLRSLPERRTAAPRRPCSTRAKKRPRGRGTQRPRSTSEPQLASRLAMWGRRLVGDTLLVARSALGVAASRGRRAARAGLDRADRGPHPAHGRARADRLTGRRPTRRGRRPAWRDGQTVRLPRALDGARSTHRRRAVATSAEQPGDGERDGAGPRGRRPRSSRRRTPPQPGQEPPRRRRPTTPPTAGPSSCPRVAAGQDEVRDGAEDAPPRTAKRSSTGSADEADAAGLFGADLDVGERRRRGRGRLALVVLRA